ncbi:unnamed protein product [Durusdinium trenchii]|uniref:Uncharacterized protein n=1 Tax=Durusdinium trenchii TaxID=1381693 RepID=A0ABP0P7T8_9DINO
MPPPPKDDFDEGLENFFDLQPVRKDRPKECGMPPPSKDDFDEGLENFFDLQSVPEAQELGSTERTAELAQTRPQGPKLLSEVCRRVREAAEKQFEQEIAEMGPTGNVAWFLSKALNTGLCCVVAPVPRFELNAFDPVEGTCLHFATSQELPSAALALLSCADFDPSVSKKRERDESTALHLAAANGQEAVVQALLNRSDFAELVAAMDKDGFTALHGAAFRGHLPCVQLLVRCPTVTEDLVTARGVFDVARPEGHWAKEAYQIYDMNTALHMAAAMGHTDICALLLIHGPAAANKANRMGATALHMAAKGGFTKTVAAILSSPAFTAVNARDARGFTALHWAAHQVTGEIAALIVEDQDFFQVGAKDLRGRTAANIAEELGYPEVLHQILHRSLEPFDSLEH